MAIYALIAKYRGAPAVYTREATDGALGASGRVAENLVDYAAAKKVVTDRGFVLVKSWKDAEQMAAMELKAELMQPDAPLTWKNRVNGWHRAKTDGGVYNVRRWYLQEDEWVPAPADGSAVGASDAQKWVITFDPAGDDTEAETVPWWKDETELAHSLEHAKTSCQHHANARLLSLV